MLESIASPRTLSEWNGLSVVCAHASSVNIQEQNRQVSRKCRLHLG